MSLSVYVKNVFSIIYVMSIDNSEKKKKILRNSVTSAVPSVETE